MSQSYQNDKTTKRESVLHHKEEVLNQNCFFHFFQAWNPTEKYKVFSSMETESVDALIDSTKTGSMTNK